MRITDLLKQDTAILDLQAQGKEAIIDELIAKLNEAGRLADPQAFREAITLPASHGGIFVIALVNKPLLYLLAILIGSVLSAFTLGAWKKKIA